MTHQMRPHIPFLLHILSLFWLLTSSCAAYFEGIGKLENVSAIALLVAATIFSYVFFWLVIGTRIARKLKFISETQYTIDQGWIRISLIALTCVYLLVMVTHYLIIGSFPLITILNAKSDIGISIIRQDGYFGLPLWARYASDICIKCLGPILLVLTAYFRFSIFWFVLLAGVTYTTMLIARSLPLLLLLPLLLFFLTSFRFVRASLVAGLVVVLLLALTTVSSVTMRETAALELGASTSIALGMGASNGRIEPDNQPIKPLSWQERSPLYAIYERAVLVPGRVIEQWFAFYRTAPYENGCAYQRLAPVLGCKFVNVPIKLYEHYYHENINAGMLGSLNAASFMLEWANFGLLGMIVSATMGAALFTMITIIYEGHPLAIPMNAGLILSLLETGFFTAIASGSGWFLTTALFVLFFRRMRNG